MKIPLPENSSVWRIAGWASFAITVALFMFVSSRAGIKWLGVVMLVGAVVQPSNGVLHMGWKGGSFLVTSPEFRLCSWVSCLARSV